MASSAPSNCWRIGNADRAGLRERPAGTRSASVLEHRGVRVPDDLALVGYDDVDFAASLSVPLTTVRQDKYLLGQQAAELAAAGAARREPRAHRGAADSRAGGPGLDRRPQLDAASPTGQNSTMVEFSTRSGRIGSSSRHWWSFSIPAVAGGRLPRTYAGCGSGRHVERRTTSSGMKRTCSCWCDPSPSAASISASSSSAARRPSSARGCRIEESGTAAAAAKAMSS